MGSCAAPSAKGDDKFITTDYLQQCLRRHAGLVRIKLHYEAAVHTAPGERMDSEEPPNVRVACSG
ncbi:hypothetical protein AB9K17_23260, partial [Salmonella enterica subsp. enterica serovar Kentucky]